MLRIKLSGALRQVAGRSEVNVELPASRRLGQVLDELAAAYPGILGTAADYQWRHGSNHVLVAVNGQIVEEGDGAGRELLLADGAEITLVPPLGGGED